MIYLIALAVVYVVFVVAAVFLCAPKDGLVTPLEPSACARCGQEAANSRERLRYFHGNWYDSQCFKQVVHEYKHCEKKHDKQN